MNKSLSPEVDKKLKILIVAVGLLDLIFQYVFRVRGVGVANSGISFGLFSNSFHGLLNLVWLGLLVAVFFEYRREKVKRLSLFMLLVGGTINVISRFIFGNVWDYISLPLAPFSNNIADILITTGVVIYLIGK